MRGSSCQVKKARYYDVIITDIWKGYVTIKDR